jgi:hypothetical protein
MAAVEVAGGGPPSGMPATTPGIVPRDPAGGSRTATTWRHGGALAGHAVGRHAADGGGAASATVPDPPRGRPAAGRDADEPDLRFICREVFLRVERTDVPMLRHLRKGKVLRL